MKCDYCDKKATVFLTQLVEGQMKKVCLCDPCAKEQGVTDPTGFSMIDLLQGGLPDHKVETSHGPALATGAAVSGGQKCPSCGFTLEDLRRVRRFGCGECYHTFGDEVAHMVRTMHKGSSHIGKVPEGLMAAQVRHQRLEELKTKLDAAIASESYEEAASLRDEISQLNDAPA